jgi:hypothetical protein
MLTHLTAAAAVLFSLATAASAQQRPVPSKPGQTSYAIVAGTVFQEDGRLLRGAEVTVKASPEGEPAPKGKPLTAATDQRGEFAFRVPASPMRYTVGIRAPGFRAQGKVVTIQGDERVDVFFQLERDAPGK